MTKSQARSHCLQNLSALRASLPKKLLPQISPHSILTHLPDQTSQILLYLPTPIEPKTQDLIKYFFQNRIQIFIPNTSQISPCFTQFTKTTNLSQTSFKTIEEESPEKYFSSTDFTHASFALIPCVGTNKSNYRIGYGSGFYDRFLKDFPGKTLGICSQKNIVDFTPEAHDIPLDQIVFW